MVRKVLPEKVSQHLSPPTYLKLLFGNRGVASHTIFAPCVLFRSRKHPFTLNFKPESREPYFRAIRKSLPSPQLSKQTKNHHWLLLSLIVFTWLYLALHYHDTIENQHVSSVAELQCDEISDPILNELAYKSPKP